MTPRLRHTRPGWQLGTSGADLDLPEPDGRDRRAPEFDLAVVGLGGSGLEAVSLGAQLGLRVLGVDQSQVAAGAAGANGGFLLAGLADFHPEAAARFGRSWVASLHRRTEDFIRRMRARDPDLIRPTGSLRRADSPQEQAAVRRHFDLLNEDGIRVRWIPDQGVMVLGDACFHPLRVCARQARRARILGARLLRFWVQRVEPGVLWGRDGSCFRARRIILAVDGHLESLWPPLQAQLRTVYLQMLATEPDPEVRCPRPVYSRWGLDYWQQLPDGRWMVGGGRDLDPACHRSELSEPVQAHLDHLVARLSPARTVARWAAPVGMTRDRLPLCGPVAPGVWAVGGLCGTGNVLGRMLARQAVYGTLDMDPMDDGDRRDRWVWMGGPASWAARAG